MTSNTLELASPAPSPASVAPIGLRQPRVFNRVSRQRFTRNRTDALIAHLGREPTYPERMLISRIVSDEWRLLRYEARMDAGDELPPHAIRDYGAAGNRIRLDLIALGLSGRPRQRRRTLLERMADDARAAA